MKTVFRYLKPYALLAIISPLLMIGEVMADLFLPKLMTVIVDYGINAAGDVSESELGSTVMRLLYGEGTYSSMQVIITFGVLMLLVVLVGGFFGVFAVLVAVDALVEVLEAGLAQILLAKQLAADGQQRGNGPAVVGRVEAALQKTSAAIVNDPVHFIQQQRFPGGQLRPALQISGQVQNDFNAECRIRGREKVAGNIVKQAVFMLGGADVVQSPQHGGQKAFVVIEV